MNRRGFSLLELLVVLAILSLLGGGAVFGAFAIRESVHAGATVTHLRRAGDAVHRYVADVASTNEGLAALPPDLAHLYSNPSGVSGWRGPYVLDRRAALSLASGPPVDLDAWGRPITYERLGLAPGAPAADVSRVRLSSSGADGAAGTADDLVFEIEAAPELRAETRRRLDRIGEEILEYHRDHLYGPPVSPTDTEPPAGTGGLPADWDAARTTLVAAGYLPDENRYKVDAWGDAFVTDGFAPLARVVSVHASPVTSSPAPGPSGGGKTKKPKKPKKPKPPKGSSGKGPKKGG